MHGIFPNSSLAARRLRLLCATVGVAFLTACSGGAGSPTGTPPTPPVVPTGPTDVTVVNSSFTPASLSIANGSSVTWTWNTCSGGDGYGGGQTCVSHNIVFDDGPTSGVQSQGSYLRKFTAVGTYPYHCSIHGTAMSGTVVVQ
jgi:plastocyanin